MGFSSSSMGLFELNKQSIKPGLMASLIPFSSIRNLISNKSRGCCLSSAAMILPPNNWEYGTTSISQNDSNSSWAFLHKTFVSTSEMQPLFIWFTSSFICACLCERRSLRLSSWISVTISGLNSFRRALIRFRDFIILKPYWTFYIPERPSRVLASVFVKPNAYNKLSYKRNYSQIIIYEAYNRRLFLF